MIEALQTSSILIIWHHNFSHWKKKRKIVGILSFHLYDSPGFLDIAEEWCQGGWVPFTGCQYVCFPLEQSTIHHITSHQSNFSQICMYTTTQQHEVGMGGGVAVNLFYFLSAWSGDERSCIFPQQDLLGDRTRIGFSMLHSLDQQQGKRMNTCLHPRQFRHEKIYISLSKGAIHYFTDAQVALVLY